MGERRRELGLPPKAKTERKQKNSENKFSLSRLSINRVKSEYTATPLVITALDFIVLQCGGSLNS